MASSPSSSQKATRKAGKGKRRIEIKKLEQASKRLVTFSKRKLGLFRKAAELSLLCDSQIAVIVFSQLGKVYSSGYPDADSVIRRYLSATTSSSSDPTPPIHEQEAESAAMLSLRREYEEAMEKLEDERKSLSAATEIGGSGCGHELWWDRPVGEMGLEEVVRFKERLEELRQNLVAAAEKKKNTWLINLPPPVTTVESLYLSLLNDDVYEIDQAWEWDSWYASTTSSNGSSSMVQNRDLDHS